MDTLIKIDQITPSCLFEESGSPYYMIFLFDGDTSFSVDFTKYTCQGTNLLFTSPYQLLKWNKSSAPTIHRLKFHGDFYCIEYHRKEVACNGVLFNNIYHRPFVSVPESAYLEVSDLVQKMSQLIPAQSTHDVPIVRSYLQLLLAMASKEKLLATGSAPESLLPTTVNFRTLLEQHCRNTKEVSFYASELRMSVGTFSKKVRNQYGKSPSKLIREYIVLEAKKLLHMTYKPIKEIAADLCFTDEFYFSRYFKKEVGVSPRKYRADVGISIAAK